jgi:hypothetical protein
MSVNLIKLQEYEGPWKWNKTHEPPVKEQANLWGRNRREYKCIYIYMYIEVYICRTQKRNICVRKF